MPPPCIISKSNARPSMSVVAELSAGIASLRQTMLALPRPWSATGPSIRMQLLPSPSSPVTTRRGVCGHTVLPFPTGRAGMVTEA